MMRRRNFTRFGNQLRILSEGVTFLAETADLIGGRRRRRFHLWGWGLGRRVAARRLARIQNPVTFLLGRVASRTLRRGLRRGFAFGMRRGFAFGVRKGARFGIMRILGRTQPAGLVAKILTRMARRMFR